jgi:hypothetical protein
MRFQWRIRLRFLSLVLLTFPAATHSTFAIQNHSSKYSLKPWLGPNSSALSSDGISDLLADMPLIPSAT